jgi:hypothetical protein
MAFELQEALLLILSHKNILTILFAKGLIDLGTFLFWLPVEFLLFGGITKTAGIITTQNSPAVLSFDQKCSLLLKKHQRYKPKIATKLSNVLFVCGPNELVDEITKEQPSVSKAIATLLMTPIRKSIPTGNVKELISQFGSPLGPRKKLDWL